MIRCNNCTRQTPYTISCPLNGKTTCFKCHDRLCPKLNFKLVIKFSEFFQGFA